MTFPLSPEIMFFMMMVNPINSQNSYGHEDPSSLDLLSQLHLHSVETAMDANNNGVVHVSPPVLLLSAVPLLCIAFVGHKFDLGLENTLIVGIVRSFVQLMILGLILHPIFVMGMDWPWLVFLCELFPLSLTYLPDNYNLLTNLSFSSIACCSKI